MAVLTMAELSVSVTDNLDGTATAAVTGGASGQAVRLLRAAWNPVAGTSWAWTQVSSGTFGGAGTASLGPLATTPGFYQWMALHDSGSTTVGGSPAVFRPVIDTADPVHKRILDAVVTAIRALNLSGIGGAANKVFARWVPRFIEQTANTDASGGSLPLCVVGPYPKEVPLGLLTNRDDVGYPVCVAFFAALNQTNDNDLARNLKWRRQVGARFRAQQLTGVSEVVLCDWFPDVIAAPDAIQKGFLIGVENFLFRSRESRGLIA